MPTTLSWTITPDQQECCPPSVGVDFPLPLGPPPASCPKSAIATAKDAMFLDTAVERDLDRLGVMFLIGRPEEIGDNDTLYRLLVQLLAFSPKQVLKCVYDLLGVLFGTQEFILSSGKQPWRVFEVFVNEIIVEIPLSLTSSGLPNATYLHGLGADGNGYTTGANTALFVVGDDMTKAASSFSGLELDVLLSGTLTPFTLVSVSYNHSTRVNTFTISPGGLPLNTVGLSWRVLIPDTVSYLGDYFLKDATHPESEVDSNVIVLYGEGLIDVFENLMLTIVKASGVKLRIERI